MRRPPRLLLRWPLLPPGLALIVVGLLIQGGVALSASQPTVTAPTATAVHDRLAEPTLPALPSQADRGAQVYWLSCMPCHGDQGQGLTDEFRQVYPPEDRSCWNSGCHGDHPYQNGFQLPHTIPALVGPGVLGKFGNAANLRSFISTAMPFWKPGSLSEDESWQVTAFLLRQNGIRDAPSELNNSNAAQVLLNAADPTAPVDVVPPPASRFPFVLIIAGIVVCIVILVIWVVRRNKSAP